MALSTVIPQMGSLVMGFDSFMVLGIMFCFCRLSGFGPFKGVIPPTILSSENVLRAFQRRDEARNVELAEHEDAPCFN